jgi:hypothetical protein
MNTISVKNSREGSFVYREQLITIEDLDTFKSQLLEEIKKLLIGNLRPFEKKCFKSSEVKRMLGISSGTLQNLRVNGTLPYSKIGRLIFYQQDDVDRLLTNSKSK